MTDKIHRYPVAYREVIPDVIQVMVRYANNRIEQLHEVTRVRERGMRKFKSMVQTQRFFDTHAAMRNLFNLGRHLSGVEHYRSLRACALDEWNWMIA